MASTPLTLAALATSAVPGLRVDAYRDHQGAEGFTSAVILSDDTELIVRVPRSSAAEVQLSAEMLGLAALAEGAREALPFAVPQTLGITRSGDTRAVVTTFLSGAEVAAHDIASDALLLQPLAETLVAIHQLPTTIVQESGLSTRSAADARAAATRLVERAAETRMLPDTVHTRWLSVLSAKRLWDFAPCVVHGSLDASQLVIVDDHIVGVLGWNELAVSDPALDLAWLLEAGNDVLEGVVARYTADRGGGGGAELRARAKFYHELEIARWLLHGVDTHDQSVVDDAISMLDRLVDHLVRLGGPLPERPASNSSEAERLLDERPELPVDLRSETAEYEALDEDRAFEIELEFGDDPAVPDSDVPGAPDGEVERPHADRPTMTSAEHPTEPIDPADLPSKPEN